MFEFNLSDGIEEEMGRLSKRDRTLLEALGKKIEEIISRDHTTIDYYKNLNAQLNEYKRVQIGHFVLTIKNPTLKGRGINPRLRPAAGVGFIF